MARYRLTVRKTEVSHEVIEVSADTMFAATSKGTKYIDEVPGARRAVTIVQAYGEDKSASVLTELIAVRER